MDRGAPADAGAGRRTINLSLGEHADITTMDVAGVEPLNKNRSVQEVEIRLARRVMVASRRSLLRRDQHPATLPLEPMFACAAARRATGMRGGEQET